MRINKKPQNKRLNRYERLADQHAKAENTAKGKGLYLYKNRSSTATLHLPKQSHDGKKIVAASGTFEGDDYFMMLVKNGTALVVDCITKPENNMPEEKLILDQPPTVTQKGQVEHVVVPEKQQLTETTPVSQQTKEVLLTEDPVDDLEILNG